ncbi:ATP-independent RNA helicase DbpA [Povalibacter uvarum]|uniref:ATP-independent RNA helicase DbpA n=1 Tax=Povalibacter uvarum TaxID=732238 RepID=A0A841HS84_9GAMM|nr:ATP-dependent RNA helicase DbpA [Povalibacter uvarum]MBB6096241.1 ATP-independent RNA helicase DbpA [Povalibacter uvarum]
MTHFSALNLSAPLQRALAEVDYDQMTPVQEASLPPILAGRDVVAQARTGSGKTAAFALGMLSRLDAAQVRLQSLVLCPTRELADQVSREIRRLARFIPNVKVLTLCGGVPLRPHLASLAHEPHIVVGTPGRILELVQKSALPLGSVEVMVLDEADRMLDMGFADDLHNIIEAMPARRQTLMFSATIPASIREISGQFQRDAVDVTVADAGDESPIAQTFFEVDADRKIDALEALLLEYRPESAVVFCNTRQEVRAVAEALDARGFAVLALHGELDQRDREEMLVRFANRSCTVLVASDVAARGLDIADLPMVINYDIASDADTHLHRIGRTGRAGREGIALSLCTPREMNRANVIQDRLGQRLHWEKLPVPDDRSALLAANLTLAIDAGKQDKLRPGDVLGALTGDAGLPADAVGKIDVFPTRTYVAIARESYDKALQRLRGGKIKGRAFRVRKIVR